MLYPIATFEDGTEVTASRPSEEGNVILYIEKFDSSLDSFINASIELPSVRLLSSFGYNAADLNNMISEYGQVKDDILEYIHEKELAHA